VSEDAHLDRADLDPASSIRVHAAGDGIARVYAGTGGFEIEGRTRFRAGTERPSALDSLLGALGADLALAFGTQARRAGLAVRGVELSLTARLDNPLVALGVVGEEGTGALAEVTGSAFASSDADPAALDALWQQAVAHSTVHATLARAARVRLVFHVVP
jgi:hypothetical protein